MVQKIFKSKDNVNVLALINANGNLCIKSSKSNLSDFDNHIFIEREDIQHFIDELKQISLAERGYDNLMESMKKATDSSASITIKK